MINVNEPSQRPNKCDAPAIYILHGKTGSGKSSLIDRYISKHPNDIALYRPNDSGAALTIDSAAHLNRQIIAVDELYKWQPASVPDSIRELEHIARRDRINLIITIQERNDLELLHISFSRTPLFIKVDHNTTTESLKDILDHPVKI